MCCKGNLICNVEVSVSLLSCCFLAVQGCEECCNSYEHGCPQHRVQTICDKPVPSRAWATLPVSYLAINKVGTTSTGSPGE